MEERSSYIYYQFHLPSLPSAHKILSQYQNLITSYALAEYNLYLEIYTFRWT